MRTCIVYGYKNKINGKWYIGETWSDRESDRRSHHRSDYSKYINGYSVGCPKFYNAIKKYGWDNFEYVVLEKYIPHEDVYDREIYWGEFYDSINNGYNLKLGGDYKFIMSDETRLKLSKSKTGDKNPMHGMTGDKNPNFGKKWTDSKKKKFSDDRTGAKNPMYGKRGNPLSGELHPNSVDTCIYETKTVTRASFKNHCKSRNLNFDDFKEVWSGDMTTNRANKKFNYFVKNK